MRSEEGRWRREMREVRREGGKVGKGDEEGR